MKNEIILVTGPNKSGTHFMHRLLDSQPKLAVFPHDFHFLKGVWQNKELPEIKKSLFNNLFFNDLSNAQAVSRESGYQLIPKAEDNSLRYHWTDYKLGRKFNRKLFIEKTNSIMDAEDVEDLFFKFSTLYFQCFGIDVEGRAVVIHMPNDMHKSYQTLRENFENYKMLIMRRNPKQILASLKRNYRKYGYKLWGGAGMALVNGISFNREAALNSPKVMHVEYERLINQDITYFQDICSFLDIPVPKKFPMPTIMGQPWHGDGTKRSGVENTSNEYKSILTSSEKIFVTIGYTIGYSKIISGIILQVIKQIVNAKRKIFRSRA